MERMFFRTVLIFLFGAAAFVPGSKSCDDHNFRCQNGYGCISRKYFCDGEYNCNDKSDEKFCSKYSTKYYKGCPSSWWECTDERCIPYKWRCNGVVDCIDESDELDCRYLEEPADKHLSLTDPEVVPGARLARKKLSDWFLSQRKGGSTTNRWGQHLPRIAVALYFSDSNFFAPGNRTGEELSYELNLQILSRLDSQRRLKGNELVTDIHALLVTCGDPRDFHGHNLVSQLRSKADGTNPFEMLVLCNVGDAMTPLDAQRMVDVFKSSPRPFRTDTQAMALQALKCMQSKTNFTLNGTDIIDLEDELKQQQFLNGTFGSVRTTALVAQATRPDYVSALTAILNSQRRDGSFGSVLDSYYVMPLLRGKSLLSVSNSHCIRPSVTESDALSEYRSMRGKRVQVRYSVRIGDEEDLQKTWTLHVPIGSSFYDVIEIVNKLDSKQNVQYNVQDGKPYVSSVNGVEDDLEAGLYWFTFVSSESSDEEPKNIERSPADIKVREHDGLILWYRHAKGQLKEDSIADSYSTDSDITYNASINSDSPDSYSTESDSISSDRTDNDSPDSYSTETESISSARTDSDSPDSYSIESDNISSGGTHSDNTDSYSTDSYRSLISGIVPKISDDMEYDEYDIYSYT